MDSFAFGYDVCPRCAFASRYKKRTSVHKRPRAHAPIFSWQCYQDLDGAENHLADPYREPTAQLLDNRFHL